MNAEEFAQFLRTHPQFFDQHPELLESISVPHPYGGRAIALAERQTITLREKVKLLGCKLGEVIQFGEEDDAIRQEIVAAYQATRHVCRAFASIEVRFAGLSRHLDYYERDYTRKVGGRGFKSGPNEQFFETMELLAGEHDFIFYMEADCVPLRQGWLDRVRALAEGDPESWVIGGLYRGDEPIDDGFFMHLNGNALYRVGDPAFMEFLRRW